MEQLMMEAAAEADAGPLEAPAEAEVGLPENKVELVDLVTILRLMEVPSSLLQDLLEVICERFSLPEEPAEHGGEGQDGEEHGGQELFQLSCSSHGSHLVSPPGFLLLDNNAVLISPNLIFFSFPLEQGLAQ